MTLTTPPIIGLIGTLLKRLKGTPHVYWSMDLHPDASLALGRMSARPRWVRALAWLSGFVYRQADRVVVLGPYMADRVVLKGIARERIETIPVWSRRDEIYPVPRGGHPLRSALGLDGKFVAMYSGNLGLAHSTSEFLDWIKLLLVEDVSPDVLRTRDPARLIPPLHGALLKNEQDVHLFERLAFLHRRERG